MNAIVHDCFLNTEWNSLHLEILENALFTGDRSWYFPNVCDPYNRIYFIISGEAYLKDEHGSYPLRPGYMYLIPANSSYTYECTSIIHKFYLHFNLELYPGIDLFGDFKTLQELPYSSAVLNTILTEIKKKSFSGLLHLKPIFWQIIYEFFLHGTGDSDYMERYKGFQYQKHVLDYISAHLSAALRIQEIAAALDIPSHQLSRSFQSDTGYKLKEYIEQMLMKKARNLLRYSDMPIRQVSEVLGFMDPFYFSRFFKKYEQLSPREYRKQKTFYSSISISSN